MRNLLVVALMTGTAILGGCSGDDEHAVGDSVEIDFYPSGESEPNGSGTIKVTGIRAGTTAELEGAGFSLDPNEQAAKVYYVDATFANQGDETVTPNDVGGEDPDGALINALVVIDLGAEPFAPCPGVPSEVAAGEEASGCTIILVPDGIEMERINYHPGGSDDFVYWKLE